MSPTTACDCGGLETIWSTWLAGNVLRGYGYSSNFGLVNVWFPMTCLLHQEIPTMIPNKKRQQKRRRLMKWIRSWRFSAWCRLWHIASCDCEILWVVPPTFLSKVFSSFVEWQEDYYIHLYIITAFLFLPFVRAWDQTIIDRLFTSLKIGCPTQTAGVSSCSLFKWPWKGVNPPCLDAPKYLIINT